VSLIDGSSATNVWVERYDRQIEDIFALQDEVAARIVSALQVEIAPANRAREMRGNLASVESYDAFLRGLDSFNRGSVEDTRTAIQFYERSIALDAGFARPYAGLAMAYTRGVVNGWDLGSRDMLDRAAALVEKAKRLDPTLPQVYFVEGYNELFRRHYEAAIRSAEQAISINPSYADAYALLAWILHFAGRPADGLASMQQAVRLNPRVPAIYRAVRGVLYYSSHAIDEAVADLEAASGINPSYQLQRLWLVAAYAAAGRISDAEWEGGEILALDPDFTIARVEQTLPIRDPMYRERFLGDLRRGGLPQ
jgi:adenylate cyclase